MKRSDEEILAMPVAEFRRFVKNVPDADKDRYRKLRVKAAQDRYQQRRREQLKQEARASIEWLRPMLRGTLMAYVEGGEETLTAHIEAITQKMTRRELAEVLDGLPEDEQQLFRELRRRMQLRVGQAAYRETHRDEERQRALDHYHAKMDELRQHPRKLAAHRARDAERKRRERAAKRES